MLCCTLVPAFPCTSRAEVSYFPVPAVSTSKNDGSEGGFIVPILRTDEEGDLTHLIAPLFVVNTIVGARGSVDLFRFWSGGRRLRFVGMFTQKIERRLEFEYSDPAFYHGLFTVDLGSSFFKNATNRFYGIGQNSLQSNQTNYTAREVRAHWAFGVYLNPVSRLIFAQRFREVRVERGATSLPYTAASFPSVQGINGASILGHRLTFRYDTRDNLVTPTTGSLTRIYAGININTRKSNFPTYFRYGLEFRKLFPSPTKRMIFVVRGLLQATFGQDIPFYELSSLGGQDTLRGYGQDRFIDKHMVVLNAEQRIHLFQIHVFNVNAEFSVAPFVDMGKVFHSFNTKLLTDYQVTPGFGLRGLVRPNLVGRVDIGFSREGNAVFAGLDFPF